MEDVAPLGDRLMSTEEQVTLITDSLSVTSSDQEKLLLLDKNTELRRVNKELMKLNDSWDQVYRSATLALQNRLEALELEKDAMKQLNSRLLLKVEHHQCVKEYYEAALMEQLKKNQELQEHVRLQQSRMQQPERDCTPSRQGGAGPDLPRSDASPYIPAPSFFSASSGPEPQWQGKGQSSSSRGGGGGGGGGVSIPLGMPGDSRREVQALKEQLEALRCQTEIYETEYQTEHNEHKHTQQENRRLRRKREEMRQQVALLQEQLKIYEDDFRRERSDKQMLQRLLMHKTPPNKDAVLVHRCNNEEPQTGGDNGTPGVERRKLPHPLCPKHTGRGKEAH